jgi:hypothetical protein
MLSRAKHYRKEKEERKGSTQDTPYQASPGASEVHRVEVLLPSKGTHNRDLVKSTTTTHLLSGGGGRRGYHKQTSSRGASIRYRGVRINRDHKGNTKLRTYPQNTIGQGQVQTSHQGAEVRRHFANPNLTSSREHWVPSQRLQ